MTVASTAFAAPEAGKKSPDAAESPRELALVVVESVEREQGAITDFDRMDLAFREVVEKRKWPVKLVAERFAANTQPHETELRVFHQSIREETSGDLTFRAWMTLTDHGTKHDFGIITYRYYPRPGERYDEQLEKIFRGAANAAADKLEPILFGRSTKTKS